MEVNFKGTIEEFTATFRLPLAEWHTEVISLLNEVKAQGTTIMANATLAKEALALLNERTNTLADAVGQLAASDQAEDDAFKAKISELEAKVTAGDAVTAEDIQAFADLASGTTARADAIKALEDALRAMGTNPTDPIPPVEIPPVEEVPPVETPPNPPVDEVPAV